MQQQQRRRRQEFPIARIQQWANKHAFSARHQALEDERCACDLLYALFRRPHTVLPKLLPATWEVVAKKNEIDAEGSPMFCTARHDLIDPNQHADDHIRIFAVLVVINREPEVHAVIRDGYLDGNVFGSAKDGCAQFTRFLPHLAQLIDGLCMAPFGEANVLQRVFELVVGSEIFYLSK